MVSIAYGLDFSACGVARRTGEISLAAPGCALQADVVSFLNVAAGGIAGHLGSVQPVILIVFDPLRGSRRNLHVSFSDAFGNSVRLSAVPFRVNLELLVLHTYTQLLSG